jgi:hypothetical protein
VVAFELWWASARVFTLEGKLIHSFSSDIDYDKIEGGGFLWSEYGIGIDFQRYGKAKFNPLELYLM